METYNAPGIILDSSVWIAYLHEGDSQHEKAMRTVDVLTDPVIVPDDVLNEVGTTLKNKGREDLAKHFVREVVSVSSMPLLVLDEDVVRRVANTFLSRSGDSFFFTDTALLVLSDEYRVITFDKKLQKAIKRAHPS